MDGHQLEVKNPKIKGNNVSLTLEDPDSMGEKKVHMVFELLSTPATLEIEVHNEKQSHPYILLKIKKSKETKNELDKESQMEYFTFTVTDD